MTKVYSMEKSESGLDDASLNLLPVDRLEDFTTTTDGRFFEGLTLTQLEQGLGFLKFLLILFQRLVDVFAIL